MCSIRLYVGMALDRVGVGIYGIDYIGLRKRRDVIFASSMVTGLNTRMDFEVTGRRFLLFLNSNVASFGSGQPRLFTPPPNAFQRLHIVQHLPSNSPLSLFTPSSYLPHPNLLSKNLKILCIALAPSTLHSPPNWETGEKLTLLRQQQTITLLQRHTVPAVLVIRAEPRRMRTLGHLASIDLLQGVDARALGVKGVHEMHGGGKRFWMNC